MTPPEIVFAAFTAFNALQIVSYIPQIACVIRDRNGASAISYSCWAIWLAGSAATTAYALVNIWDVWLALVNAVHTICWGLSQISALNGMLTVGREIPALDVLERTDDSECHCRKTEAPIEG